MASIGKSLNIEQYGQTAAYYSLTITHNTPTAILTGIVPLKTPINVVYMDGNLLPAETVQGIAWTIGANNVPSVTILFSANVTRDVQLAVCYLIAP